MNDLIKLIEQAKKLIELANELAPIIKALEESNWQESLSKWEEVKQEGKEPEGE